MTLGELFDSWKNRTPASGLQGVRKTFMTAIGFVGDLPVSRIPDDSR